MNLQFANFEANAGVPQDYYNPKGYLCRKAVISTPMAAPVHVRSRGNKYMPHLHRHAASAASSAAQVRFVRSADPAQKNDVMRLMADLENRF